MKNFFTASLAFLFALSAAADYNTVITDITTVGNLITVLDNDTLAVVPGVAGVPFALQVEVDAVNLDNAILAATRDVDASAPFGEPGSLSVSGAVINLTSKVQKALADVTAQKDAFGELSPIVLSSLYQLKMDTDVFGKAVIAKLALVEQLLAPAIIAQIDGYFNSAITAYGGKV
ncbi:hydrophobic surface binding protein A-domain-containing protein [Rhexocercosporidium sp. MPI-PUGE-AT-0058]|nr:hydrophobic surface binding protein A-domain-containing protein [Rhexocercosporidium sp. MPI-PUGE-AT-0058]